MDSGQFFYTLRLLLYLLLASVHGAYNAVYYANTSKKWFKNCESKELKHSFQPQKLMLLLISCFYDFKLFLTRSTHRAIESLQVSETSARRISLLKPLLLIIFILAADTYMFEVRPVRLGAGRSFRRQGLKAALARWGLQLVSSMNRGQTRRRRWRRRKEGGHQSKQ